MKSSPERGPSRTFLIASVMLIFLIACFLIATAGILPHEQAAAAEPPATDVLYYYAGMPDWVAVYTKGCPVGYEGPYVASAAIPGRPPPGWDLACARCPGGKGLHLIQSHGSGTAQFMCSCGTNVWNGETCATPPEPPAGSFPPAVTSKSTVTSVTCSPDSVPVGDTSTCTVTVKDTSGSPTTPTGTVNWSTSGTGNFNSTSCTLDTLNSTSGRCFVTYTPTAVGSGSHTLTASYPGDSTHGTSSGTFDLHVEAGGGVTFTGTLTVIKVVTNDDGGTADVGDFDLFVSNTSETVQVSSGVPIVLDAGDYTVSETGPSGYAATFSGACDGSDQVTLGVGDDVTCTITNDDAPATLTVIKHVVNNDGGANTAADFQITVAGSHVKPSATFPGAESPGTTVTLDAGSYTVSEVELSGYAASYDGCSGTIANGESKTCTITNDDRQPTATPKSIKQGVLQDLIALRGTVTDKKDGKKLDEAIKHLSNSLDQGLWLDETRLNAKKGEKVFQEEKNAVLKLVNLINDEKSTVDETKLQDFINRLLSADRGLASAAINDATAAGGDAKKIAKANEDLDKGDGRAAEGDFAGAIRQYRKAWTHAQQA